MALWNLKFKLSLEMDDRIMISVGTNQELGHLSFG